MQSKLPQRKISHYDMTNLTTAELKNKYRMNTQELEWQVRHECMDANKNDQKKFYQSVYNKKII